MNPFTLLPFASALTPAAKQATPLTAEEQGCGEEFLSLLNEIQSDEPLAGQESLVSQEGGLVSFAFIFTAENPATASAAPLVSIAPLSDESSTVMQLPKAATGEEMTEVSSSEGLSLTPIDTETAPPNTLSPSILPLADVSSLPDTRVKDVELASQQPQASAIPKSDITSETIATQDVKSFVKQEVSSPQGVLTPPPPQQRSEIDRASPQKEVSPSLKISLLESPPADATITTRIVYGSSETPKEQRHNASSSDSAPQMPEKPLTTQDVFTAATVTGSEIETTSHPLQMDQPRPALGAELITPHKATASPPLLSQQILPALPETMQQVTEVTLSPEELGTIKMEFRGDTDKLVLLINAERPETLELLRRQADRLLNEIRNAGYGDVKLDFGQSSEGSKEQRAPRQEATAAPSLPRDAPPSFSANSSPPPSSHQIYLRM